MVISGERVSRGGSTVASKAGLEAGKSTAFKSHKDYRCHLVTCI